MNGDTIFVFSLLGVAGVMFASGRVRMDVTALLIVLALGLSGVVTIGEAVSGFGDPVILLVACLLVVGEMLSRTGIVHAIGNWLMRIGGKNEVSLLVVLMLAAGVLGSVMSSTAVVAMLIPVALTIARRTSLNPSRLLLPLAYGSLISGMMTLIATTPNLVVSAELEDSGYDSLGFFGFTPIGVAVLIVGVLYIVLMGRRLLPGDPTQRITNAAMGMLDMMEEFGLVGAARRLQVRTGSQLSGKTLAAAELSSRHGVRVVIVERTERRGVSLVVIPSLDFELRTGDVLVSMVSLPVADEEREKVPTDDETDFAGTEEPAAEEPIAPEILEKEHLAAIGLEFLPVDEHHRTRWMRELGMATVLIHPESRLKGMTLKDVGFRTRYGLHVVGVRRSGKDLVVNADTELRVSDSLLVVGAWRHIHELRTETHDFVVFALPVEMSETAPARRRMPMALTILGVMVLLSALNIVPVVMAVLIAALASVITGCLSMEDSYRAIPWSSLIMIAGLLPVAGALQKTGGVDLIVDGLVAGVGNAGPNAMLTALFFLTAFMGMVLSNTATAVLMAPIAIRAAEALNVAPYAFAMSVAIAASAAFMTPVSSPVVALVVTPGKYRFVDFVKVGTPLLLLTWVVTLLVVPVFFPF